MSRSSRRWWVLVALVLVSPCPRTADAPVTAPATLVVEPPPTPPAPPPVALPVDRYAGLCETACDVRPDDPPARLPPVDPCPLGACSREVWIEFDGRLQVELGDRLLEKSGAVRRWTGPGLLQIYAAGGWVMRCSFEVAPETERIEVRWRKVMELDLGGGPPTPCETVHSPGFDFGSVLAYPPDVLDRALDAARVALSPERFADDRDVTTWLRRAQILPWGAEIARRSATGRAAAGDAVVYLDIGTSDLALVEDGHHYCSPYCDGRYRFVGELTTASSMRLFGEGERRFCERWASIEDRRFVATWDGRLVAEFALPDTCEPHWTWTHVIPRVPFTAPPERTPLPRRDPDLPARIVPADGWGLPPKPQPSARPPKAYEADIATLGAWFAQAEPDAGNRLKAVHDWIATNVAYDVPALTAAERPPQDARTVFRTREGVCAGYANLAVALGRAAGLEVVYVGGHSRDPDGRIPIDGHAWNAARVDGAWVLFDATWDAGSVGDGGFSAAYTTRWLFAPPAVFATDHHPADPAWQLLAPPESTDAFGRRPATGRDVVVVAPTSEDVAVDGALAIDLAVAEGEVSVAWRPEGGSGTTPCAVEGTRRARATCTFAGAGPWFVELADGDGALIGQLRAHR